MKAQPHWRIDTQTHKVRWATPTYGDLESWATSSPYVMYFKKCHVTVDFAGHSPGLSSFQWHWPRSCLCRRDLRGQREIYAREDFLILHIAHFLLQTLKSITRCCSSQSTEGNSVALKLLLKRQEALGTMLTKSHLKNTILYATHTA